MRALVPLLATAALAGCLQAPGPPLPPAAEAPARAQAFGYVAQACDGYLLALLVDPARTDPVLPPGFHLRDPSAFFREAPTATGQALVIVAAMACGSSSLGDGPFQEAFAAIFVQPPAVAGDRLPAQFDFYETDHVARGPLAASLAAYGWQATAANLTIQPVAVQGTPEQFTLRADGQGRLFSFGGATPAPRDYGDSLVRLWRDGPAGIARIDYTLPLQFGFGPGTCTLSATTRVAAVAGTAPPGPVVAAKLGFSFPATVVLEPGRHAR
jgi:hypothetical protein